jgi:outer membrane protein assembly factor BamD
MKMKNIISTFLIILMFTAACSSSGETKKKADAVERTYLERYEDALNAFEAKKYYRALDDFSYVVFNAPGSDIADNAQYYIASCHFEMKEYLVAIEEYQQLLRRWPRSDLHEDTRFRIAECYYRQSPGYQRDPEFIQRAIRAYQDFIEEYPFSTHRDEAEKRIREMRTGQAKKVYEAGKQYMILREWKAAIITFQEVLESYYDTDMLNDTHLQIAVSHSKLMQREEMIRALDKVNPDALQARDRITYNKLLKLSTDWPE